MDRNHSNLVNRHNMVGGQAVIEGVMMKRDEKVALAVRKEDGTVEVKTSTFKSSRKKLRLFQISKILGSSLPLDLPCKKHYRESCSLK